ncbi:MAG: DNA polymerase III subunit chi [Gammaproteobacteria bacterium]|nr:DNA polymerase III subunit chi [Gammaproteobacteria bacterium]MDH5629324.1 DNA polymerase III subunit chi [Gammaproteobacteria bacterium]
MTQIEFHSFESTSNKPPINQVCDVIKQAYRKGQKVFVHTENRRAAELIDEKLWTHDSKSFLPHQMVGEDPKTQSPIEIGFGQEPTIMPDVLINLDHQVPTFFSRFNLVHEYAYGDEESKEKAREKYRFYRQRGYPLNHLKHQ